MPKTKFHHNHGAMGGWGAWGAGSAVVAGAVEAAGAGVSFFLKFWGQMRLTFVRFEAMSPKARLELNDRILTEAS